MPRKRARMFLAWVGEHAIVILTAMLFVLVGLLVWNVVLYAKLSDTRSQLSSIEIARIVETRAANRNQVTQCYTAIPFIKSFQVLTDSVRTNLRQSATLNEKLAKKETNPALRKARLKLVKLNLMKARALVDLPQRNKKFCAQLQRDLRIKLVQKYGDRLKQLEQEERKSQKSDT